MSEPHPPPISAELHAALDDYLAARAELDGKFQAYERAKERYQRALAHLDSAGLTGLRKNDG